MNSVENNYLRTAKDLTLQLLGDGEYAVFLFGSRARGKQSRSADIDIGVLGKTAIPDKLREQLLDDFEKSDVPYKVDVIDFFNVPEQFKQVALKDIEIWHLPPSFPKDWLHLKKH